MGKKKRILEKEIENFDIDELRRIFEERENDDDDDV